MSKELVPMIVNEDLTPEMAAELEVEGKENGLAVDIETTGLSPVQDRIAVVSISAARTSILVMLSDQKRPHFLSGLLENGFLKIFHHALFDLSFFKSQWDVRVENVFCTKVAARIAGLKRDPTLQDLVQMIVGVEISKEERTSDWTLRPLTERQVQYAATDVAYLHRLQQELSWKLSDAGRSKLFESCMRFLPARVELGLLSLHDVFAYKLTRPEG